jgi:hypothetical protein
MSKIASIVALAAAVLFSGPALQTQARADERAPQGNAPIGDVGAHWNGLCWIATAPGVVTYYGYWGTCPKPTPHQY